MTPPPTSRQMPVDINDVEGREKEGDSKMEELRSLLVTPHFAGQGKIATLVHQVS